VRYYRTGLFRHTRFRNSANAEKMLSPSVRLALIVRPYSPVKVSFIGYVCLSVPSPCERRDRLRVLWTDPTPCHLRLSYLIFRFGLPDTFQEWSEPPKSLVLLSTHTALFVDPGRPFGLLPVTQIPLCGLPVR